MKNKQRGRPQIHFEPTTRVTVNIPVRINNWLINLMTAKELKSKSKLLLNILESVKSNKLFK